MQLGTLNINRRNALYSSNAMGANVVMYGMTGSGKTTIIREDIIRKLSDTQEDVYLFTFSACMKEYSDLLENERFHLYPLGKLADSTTISIFLKGRATDASPIWLYIDSGDMLSESELINAELIYDTAKENKIIPLIAFQEYEPAIGIRFNKRVSCFVFMEMKMFQLNSFPAGLITEDEKKYLDHGSMCTFSRKAIVKVKNSNEKWNVSKLIL